MPRAALINPSNYPLWLILHPTPTPSAEVASPIVAPEADGHGGETPKGGRCDIAVCDIARRREIVPGEPTGFISCFFFDLVSPLFSPLFLFLFLFLAWSVIPFIRAPTRSSLFH